MSCASIDQCSNTQKSGDSYVQTVDINLYNQNVQSIECDADNDSVIDVIEKIVKRISNNSANTQYYGLRLYNVVTQEKLWLVRMARMHQVLGFMWNQSCLHITFSDENIRSTSDQCSNSKDFKANNQNELPSSWRLELRVRYIPVVVQNWLVEDNYTCNYFFDQVHYDYLQLNLSVLETETAIELCCIAMRHRFKNITPIRDKKQLYEHIEKEIGLKHFLPNSVIMSVKPKNLKKMIQTRYKQTCTMMEIDYMRRFYDILNVVTKIDEESFSVTLSSAWNISGILNISPKTGISYQTHPQADLTNVAAFKDILKITTQFNAKDNVVYKHLITPMDPKQCHCQKLKTQINISTCKNDEDLVITCNGLYIAESIADLIDGYCKLFNQLNQSIWQQITQLNNSKQTNVIDESNSKGDAIQSNRPMLSEDYVDIGLIEEDGDYSTPTGRNYELERSNIVLHEIIGVGQFGDVYIGQYQIPCSVANVNGTNTTATRIIDVAVKTCKSSDIPEKTEKFMEEAYTMQKFDHQHIIRLIGTCSKPPIWIVMELAKHGELRAYLKANSEKLKREILLLYCYQLSTALSYLESKKFVHRDIAARNVLVSTPTCVKLADFGLSRWVSDQSYYHSSTCMLPIKWMAPESINFRIFTTASDVWMFGVCAWEILTRGVKPFQGIKNSDIITKLENGERLPFPADCPPRLYSLMSQTWAYEPHKRPHFKAIKEVLYEIYVDEKTNDADSTNKKEINRRITMTTYLDTDDDVPPPKPSCTSLNTNSLSKLRDTNRPPIPQTYIIAQNPAVLARLMKENEERGINPAAYTTPVSVFNTLAVEVDETKPLSSTDPKDISLKMSKLPAAQLLKLDPTINEMSSIPEANNIKNPIVNIDNTRFEPSHANANATVTSHHQFLRCGEYPIAAVAPQPPMHDASSFNQTTEHHNTIELDYLRKTNYDLMQQQHFMHPSTNVVVVGSLPFSSSSSMYGGSGSVSSIEYQPDYLSFGSLERNMSSIAEVANNMAMHKGGSLDRNHTMPVSKTLIQRSGSLQKFLAQKSAAKRMEMNPFNETAEFRSRESSVDSLALHFPTTDSDIQEPCCSTQSMCLAANATPTERYYPAESKILNQKKRMSIISMNSEASTSNETSLNDCVNPIDKVHNSTHTNETAMLPDLVNRRMSAMCLTSKHPIEYKTEITSDAQNSHNHSATFDRKNDIIYIATTGVVKAIMSLSQGVDKSNASSHYVEMVKNVGAELRKLLSSVDKESFKFPAHSQKEVEMAYKVLSKDMHELVSSMRLAQQYSDTTLDTEYKKLMLSAAHALAMDAKNLLDVIDSIRKRNNFDKHLQLQFVQVAQPPQSTASDITEITTNVTTITNPNEKLIYENTLLSPNDDRVNDTPQ